MLKFENVFVAKPTITMMIQQLDPYIRRRSKTKN